MKGILLIVITSVLLSGCKTLGDLLNKNKSNSPARSSSQSATTNKSANQEKGFAGTWVATSNKNGKSRAHVYKFTNSKARFNASMTNYIISRGRYTKDKVQPVIWSASPDNSKIKTQLWDAKKTVYWGLTWTVKKYNKQTGKLIVNQTFDGMKGKGSLLKLRKCGTPSAKGRMYQKVCPR